MNKGDTYTAAGSLQGVVGTVCDQDHAGTQSKSQTTSTAPVKMYGAWGTVKVPPVPPNCRQLPPGAAENLPPLATDCRQVWAVLLSRCRPHVTLPPSCRPSLPLFAQTGIPQWDCATYLTNSV